MSLSSLVLNGFCAENSSASKINFSSMRDYGLSRKRLRVGFGFGGGRGRDYRSWSGRCRGTTLDYAKGFGLHRGELLQRNGFEEGQKCYDDFGATRDAFK